MRVEYKIFLSSEYCRAHSPIIELTNKCAVLPGRNALPVLDDVFPRLTALAEIYPAAAFDAVVAARRTIGEDDD